MNKKTEDALLDIAAELIVSPIALYAKANQLHRAFNESETGQAVNTTVKQAGADIGAAAKTFAESETGQKIKETANDVSVKVKEAADKAAETAVRVKDSVAEVADRAATEAVRVKDQVADAADSAVNLTKIKAMEVKEFIGENIKREGEPAAEPDAIEVKKAEAEEAEQAEVAE